VIHAFVQYRALEQQARQYKVMAKLLGAARSLWQSMTLSSAGEPSTRSLRELVNELGKEALMENADWVMLHRDRPLEVPHGK
jgi:DNA-binding IclR family transcriptional regulator